MRAPACAAFGSGTAPKRRTGRLPRVRGGGLGGEQHSLQLRLRLLEPFANVLLRAPPPPFFAPRGRQLRCSNVTGCSSSIPGRDARDAAREGLSAAHTSSSLREKLGSVRATAFLMASPASPSTSTLDDSFFAPAHSDTPQSPWRSTFAAVAQTARRGQGGDGDAWRSTHRTGKYARPVPAGGTGRAAGRRRT